MLKMLCGSALGALAAAAPVAAETAPAPLIIVSGERSNDDSETRNRPGGTDLVSAEEFRAKAAVSLRDALAFSPGVYAQPRFGQEVRLSIRGSGLSRGFHMRGLTLLQDGVPINLADDNSDFQELDPTILDRIEVYRGAAGLRFGGSTLGGAINGITPTGRTAPGLELRADAGSFDTVRGKLAGGFAHGPGDGWLALVGDTSDGDREHARRTAIRLNGNVGLQLAGTVETRLWVSGQSIRQELPGALSLATVRTRPRTGDFVGDQQRNIDSLRVQSRTTATIGGTTLQLGAFLNAKELDHPIFQYVDQVSTDWGLFGRVETMAGPIALTLGTNARFGRVEARRFVNLSGRKGAPTFRAAQAARTIDVYGEARLPLGPVTLIAGAVLTDGMRRQRQQVPAAVTGRADFRELSPRLGAIWSATDSVQLYANVSRSHELPGFIELTQFASFAPLDAQRAWTGEIGARGSVGPVRFDVAAYRAAIRGELLQFAVDVNAGIPVSTFNAGRTLHQGIEAALDVDLARWARLRQAYQFSDFRFRGDRQYRDNRLPVIPRHVYRAELRLGSEELHVAPSLEWIPQAPWADYANSFRARGYVLLGATAEVTIDRIRLFVDARNLAGRRAAGDVSAVVDYRRLTPAQQAIFYPVERRAVFAGVRAAF